MRAIKISGWTNFLEAPKDWDHHKLPCDRLYVRAVISKERIPSLTSAWMPTPEELKKLNEGCPVLLSVISTGNLSPTVVSVGEKVDITDVITDQQEQEREALLNPKNLKPANDGNGHA